MFDCAWIQDEHFEAGLARLRALDAEEIARRGLEYMRGWKMRKGVRAPDPAFMLQVEATENSAATWFVVRNFLGSDLLNPDGYNSANQLAMAPLIASIEVLPEGLFCQLNWETIDGAKAIKKLRKQQEAQEANALRGRAKVLAERDAERAAKFSESERRYRIMVAHLVGSPNAERISDRGLADMHLAAALMEIPVPDFNKWIGTTVDEEDVEEEGDLRQRFAEAYAQAVRMTESAAPAAKGKSLVDQMRRK